MVEKYDSEFLDYAVQLTTPCQKRPYVCEPRHIKHVAWDADGVIWHISSGIASSVRGPFKRIDEDTVEGSSEPYSYYEPTTPKKPKKPKEPKKGWRDFLRPSATSGFPELEAWDRELEGIAEELVGSLPEKKKEQLGETRKPEPKFKEVEIRWDPWLKGWLEKGETKHGISWLVMPSAKAPRPPGDQTKEERRYIRVEEETAPPPLLPPPSPPAPPKYEPPPRGGITVTLLPTFRDTLKELKKRGISTSVISLNTPGTVKDLLEAFGLADKFVEIRDSWENKGKVFREITSTFKITPCDAIFVDDTMGNVTDVAKECAIALHMGRDIKKPIQVLDYILPREK